MIDSYSTRTASLPKLRTFDVSLRTAFAQAKELARAQQVIPLLTAGSLQTEDRAGGKFVYRYRYDAAGKRVTEYIGATSDPATDEKVEQARAEISELAAISEYSRNLRRIGYHSADNSTVVTVASLFNAGVFSGGGVLIGTHAFGAILNELGVSASPFPQTEDVDVAAQRIKLAAMPKGGFIDLLKQTGLPFHEVPPLKRGAPSTSYKVRGRSLKVDLLVPAHGKPYQPVQIAGLGAHATGLPFLEYLLKGTIDSILIGRDRIVPVTVPHPGRFCLHKLALFRLRSASDSPKREKDVHQAAILAAALARDQEFLLLEARRAADSSLRSKLKSGAKRAMALLEDSSPEAAKFLESLA
jgi:YD repeat-containing protein